MTADREAVERENARLREALKAIRDHGNTHEQPCFAIHNGDCADVMQEIARAALATVPSQPQAEDRLWVNAERTVLGRLWSDGTMEVATRDTPSGVWGPPAILEEEP